MTLGEALAGSGLDLLESRMLLGKAAGVSRASLAAHPERELAEGAAAQFMAAVARRRAGEPVAYLLGEREFYTLALSVTPAVLIPRPETELLVDFALEKLPRKGALLDLGTGSGAIALAVKHARPDAVVTAVEQSDAAMAVARANAARHSLAIEFLQGSWLEPLGARRFDVIVTNPPYIAEGDPHLTQGDVRFEPRSALVAGPDGLSEIRRIVRDVSAHLVEGGWLAIEHGHDHATPVRELLEEAGLAAVGSRPDLAGIARISVGKYNLE